MRRKIPFLLAPLLLVVLASADTVTLKSGEKLEGTVTSETDAQVTMSVRVSAGITDERVIPKAEIANIEKVEPDEIAWQGIKNLKPGPNSLPDAQYDAILKYIEEFTTQHPKSAHVADAKKIAATFEEEKKRVEAGDVKLNGTWLNKEEVQREKYQISAQISFNYMREQASRRDYSGAMNTFDSIEKQYPGSRVYPDAVELARKVIPALKADADRRLQAIPAEKAEIERGLNLASETGKAEIRAGVQREETRAAAAIAAAEKQRLNWMPYLPKSEQALKSISDRASGEAQRISAIDVVKIRESFKFADAARAALEKKDIDGATEALQQSRTLWHENEVARRVEAALQEARVTASAAPPPPAPDPAEAPKTETPGTEPASSAAAGTPATAGSDAAEAEAEETADKPKPFFLRPAGIIMIIILVAFAIAAFNAFQKIKGRANETIE